MITYLLIRLYYDGVLIFLGHHHVGKKRGLEHVDEEIIGKNIKLLLFISGSVGGAGYTIPETNTIMLE